MQKSTVDWLYRCSKCVCVHIFPLDSHAEIYINFEPQGVSPFVRSIVGRDKM